MKKFLLIMWCIVIFFFGQFCYDISHKDAQAQDTTQYDQNNQIIRQLEEQNDILKQILEVEKRIQERVETK